ncbi:cob(II)yrinic acid a,c-diamide reductase [Chitinophaga sp. CF118]|uniref:5,6-dimethylbenzimidazole synthase n=1 Tax=Chitinophaga sp. CF118 TaxID=1884367 RepID=UPI0008F3661D|nr:5,6-dimethylbenzimidazole synthase [Chitinophaga sp. CF118]SFD48274.1 cob(II)yrinic acid a,c-diamide reductase [Chitinophaga sp. CF118]
MTTGKMFTEKEAELLEEFILNRRDVRGNRFLDKAVEDEILERLIFVALNAPSVGFSQPWEFVIVKDPVIKEQIKQTFNEENNKASACFNDEKQQEYIRLKLEGIIEAPVNIAVFYKPSTGPVLGQTSMEEVGLYSVVCAIQNMWLMARALNIGMGWVSILDPEKVKKILHAPDSNKLVAYLCIGYVDKFSERPELEILHWEKRKEKEAVVFFDRYK